MVATSTMIRLAEFRYTAVVPDQISPASFAVVFILSALRDIPLVHTFIIMKQNSRNIDTVRTRHTVFAVVTWDGRILHHQVGGVEQETVFLFRQRLQRTVGAEVVLQVLHVSHAAQHGEYARKRACKPKSPGGDAPSRFALLQAGDDMVVHVRKPSSEEWLHDDGGNPPFL